MRHFDSVQEVENWVFGQRYTSAKNGLQNIRALCRSVGDPQETLKFVHVAGTDGKGSTSAMVERMLRENGYRTGLYTSPHLQSFSERMRINGVNVAEDVLLKAADAVYDAVEALLAQDVKPNFFELTTTMAFLVFQAEKADIVVLETGLGGRLDATNVVMPLCCLITSIGMDHTKQLGDTLPKIAGEKAGIIKEGVPCAVAEQDADVEAVFEAAAARVHAPLTRLSRQTWQLLREDRFGSELMYDGFRARVPLAGHHQTQNARLAMAGIRMLQKSGLAIDDEKAMTGLSQTKWPARLEWLDDHTLLDGAHNPHGASSLRDYVTAYLAGEKVTAVVGMMKDKAVGDCARIYADIFDSAVATQIDFPRAMPAEELRDELRAAHLDAVAQSDMKKAIALAEAKGGITVICGSLYLAGDIRNIWNLDGGKI